MFLFARKNRSNFISISTHNGFVQTHRCCSWISVIWNWVQYLQLQLSTAVEETRTCNHCFLSRSWCWIIWLGWWILQIWGMIYLVSKAVTWRCSFKKLFLKNSWNSQEYTCAGVSFLIKLQAEACNFIKKETLTRVFSCEFCEIFKDIFFYTFRNF